MRVRQNKKTHFVFNLNIFKLLSLLLFFILLLFIPLIIKTSIKINKFECESQLGKCPQDLENYTLSLNGFNYQVVKKNITNYLNNSYLVESYLIQYKIPNTVKIDLNVKKPINSFVFAGDTQYFLITNEGVVVDVKDKTDLPNVVVQGNKLFKTYNLGEKVDPKILFASNIANNLNYLFSIKEVKLENEYLSAVSNEGILILMSISSETDLIVGSIRLIFSRLNKADEGIRMEDVKEIDLRYKNPILRKK